MRKYSFLVLAAVLAFTSAWLQFRNDLNQSNPAAALSSMGHSTLVSGFPVLDDPYESDLIQPDPAPTFMNALDTVPSKAVAVLAGNQERVPLYSDARDNPLIDQNMFTLLTPEAGPSLTAISTPLRL